MPKKRKSLKKKQMELDMKQNKLWKLGLLIIS